MKQPLIMKKLAVMALTLTAPFTLHAQYAAEHKEVDLARWGVGTAQYSGITPLGNGRYALVSDDEPSDGFFVMHLEQSPLTGEVVNVALEGFYGSPATALDTRGMSLRDAEGIVYHPSTNTVFISGEGDQQILEYNMEGSPTGRSLAVPEQMGKEHIFPNYGFEALGYSAEHESFWTITESVLRPDGVAAGPLNPEGHNLLRLQQFDETLQPTAQYAYRMDAPAIKVFGPTYIYGVPLITAMPDGSLLVMEREANVTKNYLGSSVACKLFRVQPAQSHQIDGSTRLDTLDPNLFMVKEIVAYFKTKLTLAKIGFANYEGMCPGIRLDDGRQTLLLVADSQGGMGKGPFRLKDYLKVLILN